MSFLSGFRTKAALTRQSEEALYAQALNEIETGTRRDGIWAMAMVQAEMDQAKAGALYLKLRVQALKDEIALRESEAVRLKSEADEANSPHPGCGGAILREEKGTVVMWRCNRCGTKGKFTRGVDYTAKKL